jgi:Spy/CpxP family protein refolding chaperone
MLRTALVVGVLALSFAAASLATGEQAKQTTGSQETPGPLGFPGIKHLTEVLMLSGEQATAIHHIYSEYQKKEQKAQQEAQKEAAKDKTPGAKPPRADTKGLRDDMVNEIKTVLTEDQRKKFDELVADMGKKKKKGT